MADAIKFPPPRARHANTRAPRRSAQVRAVQSTADDALTAKLSSVNTGYYTDPFVRYFVPQNAQQRRPPLINRGYWMRVGSIDYLIKAFLGSFPPLVELQIVSLGSGLDTTFWRLKHASALNGHTKYVEIDYPEVAARKLSRVRAIPDLVTPLGENRSALEPADAEWVSDEFACVGADLSDLSTVESAMQRAGVDFTVPTLFLSECVLVYMDSESADALISWTSCFTGGRAFVVNEQIIPDDPFGQVMVSNLRQRGIELLGFRAHPSLQAQEERFRTRGYERVASLDMNEIDKFVVPDAEKKRVFKVELFDEFEEFHLMQAHYCMTLAVSVRGAAGKAAAAPTPDACASDDALGDDADASALDAAAGAPAGLGVHALATMAFLKPEVLQRVLKHRQEIDPDLDIVRQSLEHSGEPAPGAGPLGELRQVSDRVSMVCEDEAVSGGAL